MNKVKLQIQFQFELPKFYRLKNTKHSKILHMLKNLQVKNYQIIDFTLRSNSFYAISVFVILLIIQEEAFKNDKTVIYCINEPDLLSYLLTSSPLLRLRSWTL